jgi:hypothetical protein
MSTDVKAPSLHGLVNVHKTWMKVLNDSWQEEMRSSNPSAVRLRVLIHTYMSVGQQMLDAMNEYERESHK